MNEQQLAAVKQALGALEIVRPMENPEPAVEEAITALQSIIRQHALDKKADNARELGLSYDPEHDTVDIADIIAGELKVSRGTAYDMMLEALKEASPVQEPCCYGGIAHDCHAGPGCRIAERLTATPPTPQPVPVKTYHDGKPWPVAPKPWVGLSEDEVNKLRHLVDWTAEWSYGRFAYELERLLREKNT